MKNRELRAIRVAVGIPFILKSSRIRNQYVRFFGNLLAGKKREEMYAWESIMRNGIEIMIGIKIE